MGEKYARRLSFKKGEENGGEDAHGFGDPPGLFFTEWAAKDIEHFQRVGVCRLQLQGMGKRIGGFVWLACFEENTAQQVVRLGRGRIRLDGLSGSFLSRFEFSLTQQSSALIEMMLDGIGLRSG